MAKPAPQQGDGQADSDTGQAETRTRPRTLAEAKARQQIAPGEKMKQDGGVKRRLDVDPSFDAIATPFGEYDREVIEAIRTRSGYTAARQQGIFARSDRPGGPGV